MLVVLVKGDIKTMFEQVNLPVLSLVDVVGRFFVADLSRLTGQRGHQDNVQVNLPVLSLSSCCWLLLWSTIFSTLEQTHWSKGTPRQCSGKSACPVPLLLLVTFM